MAEQQREISGDLLHGSRNLPPGALNAPMLAVALLIGTKAPRDGRYAGDEMDDLSNLLTGPTGLHISAEAGFCRKIGICIRKIDDR